MLPLPMLRVVWGFAGEPASGATQEYHVEEPDQSASEAEALQEQPSKGRGRTKKAETTPAQVGFGLST